MAACWSTGSAGLPPRLHQQRPNARPCGCFDHQLTANGRAEAAVPEQKSIRDDVVCRSVEVVDSRTEIRDFLTARRAKITPEWAGLPLYGGNRRVTGLRREEVALLAGVSIEYYTRLERGNLSGVSESVLEALARALQLDEAERAHLFDLARAPNTTGTAART